MGFLSPLFLVAAVAVAVPLVLHLVHRYESRRLAFPALRYLLRTEREHARRIRFRQLLLLLLRVAIMLLLVLAGARLFLRGAGGAHEPTALAIVLDNSLSASRVVGEERLLDRLRTLAEATLDLAGPDDRIWILRAGEPWDVVAPGDAAAARRRVRETEVSAAASDLPATVARAAALVRDAGLPAAEVQVLSDLQATAFRGDRPTPPAPRDLPVVVYRPLEEPPANRYIAELLVGGGLPPLAGRRSDVAVRVGGPEGDSAAVPLRLVVGDRIRAADDAPPGATAVLPFGPFPEGWVEGYVETDPDALRGDDRRWFSQRVRPPPRVAVPEAAPPFLAEALAVLEESGRIRRTSAAQADVALLVAAAPSPQAGTRVVVPPEDAALLPALNRRLATAGVTWRYEASPAEGETRVASDRTPARLVGLRIRRAYRLVPASGDDVLPEQVLARLEDGSAWLVEGALPGGGRYRLLASPFVPGASELPVSASMVPLVEWLLTPAGGGGESGLWAGGSLSLPSSATAVETPGGTRLPVDGTQVFRVTREPGVYAVLAGDSVLERVAVNPPPEESELALLPVAELQARLGGDLRAASDVPSWSATVFTSRQGPELWRPLLLAALVLLLLEARVAASGRAATAASHGGPGPVPREDRASAA